MKLRFALCNLIPAILIVALLIGQPNSAQQIPRRIEVTAKRFSFTPSEITLKQGDPVVLVLTSADVPHGIRFKELGIETKATRSQSGELAFTPDKTGTFVGHCSVFCGRGHGAMTLTLHIVD